MVRTPAATLAPLGSGNVPDSESRTLLVAPALLGCGPLTPALSNCFHNGLPSVEIA